MPSFVQHITLLPLKFGPSKRARMSLMHDNVTFLHRTPGMVRVSFISFFRGAFHLQIASTVALAISHVQRQTNGATDVVLLVGLVAGFHASRHREMERCYEGDRRIPCSPVFCLRHFCCFVCLTVRVFCFVLVVCSTTPRSRLLRSHRLLDDSSFPSASQSLDVIPVLSHWSSNSRPSLCFYLYVLAV